MPAPATANISMGSMVDLIGPPASAAPADGGQPDFDAILSAAPPAPMPTANDSNPPRTSSLAGSEPIAKSDEASAFSSCTPDCKAVDSSDHENDSRHKEETHASMEAGKPAAKEEGELRSELKQPDAAQDVVAASLAGLQVSTSLPPGPVQSPDSL